MTLAYTPSNLDEALQILADHPDTVLVAGCTDLMVVDYAMGRRHDAVLDLLAVPELHGIAVSDDAISIGATTKFREILNHAEVQKNYPMLAEVAGTVGGWQIQNRATIGGNIANASPAGDSLPVLLALGAQVEVRGAAGPRIIPYEAMHLGYRRVDLRPGELITRVRIQKPAANTVQMYKKVGTRAAQAISKVVVGLCATIVDDSVAEIRIGAGSVAATPVRLDRTEARVRGARLEPSLADEAGRIASTEVAPIDDVRSTAEYRSFVLGRVVRRMLLNMISGETGPNSTAGSGS